MATASHPSSVAVVQTRLPGRRFDHLFFSGMALLLATAVFAGFARTYYLAGVFGVPLPSFIIHLHGAAFSIWIGLFVTQTTLVAARRVDLHRRLGVLAFIWACLMIVLGVLAGMDALARGAGPPGRDPRSLLYCSTGGHGDLRHPSLLRLSQSHKANRSQAPVRHRYRRTVCCRD